MDFLDVRLEMADHVASVIENELEQQKGLTFYDAFKSYMVHNKKSLLNNANRYRWTVDLKILKRVGKNLIHPFIMGVMTIILLTIYTFQLPEPDKNFLIPVPFFIIFCGYFVPFILTYKIKISFLKRMTTVSDLLNYIFFQILIHIEFSHAWLYIFYGAILWVNLSVIKTAFEMAAYYKKKYVVI
ncbi:hypothetical protein [Salinimicrobium terrae]|uniref:hypothetical protein n=1 Tax=Salinimicrobium terrae TaxID=470866 RepID=UPI00040AF950|nr:hypothetical protein [Salinimicrobium terrae]